MKNSPTVRDKRKRILVAPLDWGLGHAARCVPVIKELININAGIIIAADSNPLAFLQKEFPGIETIRLPGYGISYPASGGSMAVKMGLQLPKIFSKIREENKLLQKIIKEKNISGVISDQRFGLYTKKIPCAFITHQVMIKAPFFENVLYKTNRNFIDNYSECWIPDFKGTENLSGDLSGKFPLPSNAKFIGPLSRFQGLLPTANCQLPIRQRTDSPGRTANFDIMAITSGPEPQRTIFEKLVLSQLKKSGLMAVLVKGQANKDEHYQDENVEIHSHLETHALAEKMRSSEIIIARPGYSTIMDLAALGKKAILIPTPGQTEQEYLAEYHFKKGHHYSTAQNEFNLLESLVVSRKFQGLTTVENGIALKNTLSNFTQKC